MTTRTEKVAVWLNMPSPHLEDTLRSIASIEGSQLVVFYSSPLSESRASEGWNVTPEGYRSHTFSRRLDMRNVFMEIFKDRKRVHVFGGIWSTPNIAFAITVARVLRIRFLILSESPEHPARPIPHSAWLRMTRTFKVGLRNLFSRWITSGSRGLLAISRFAETWYANHGMNPSSIYKFGYFKAAPKVCKPEMRSGGEEMKLIYVGRQSYAKGLDLLLDALEPLWPTHDKLQLLVIGKKVDDIQPGPHGLKAVEQGRLIFEEAKPFLHVERAMRQSDVLVLPSRGDGWGMVVVEALMNGVPVIVSDQCGVADVIMDGVNGFTFASGDVESLRHATNLVLLNHSDHQRLREGALKTGSLLDANFASEYLWQCIGHAVGQTLEKPVAPWLPERELCRFS